MTSTKPYFVRAIFEWCVDQGLTPYISVAVDAGTRVPREFVKDGRIVLNISPDAASQLLLKNEAITFQARFNGVAFPVVVPMDAVAAVFAKENGQGLSFEPVSAADAPALTESEPPPPQEPPPSGGRPHLTRVK
ncbi:MAG: ClpXP protease specificity-enhancing factor [Zoogloeaceae bacterium]|nr:ClpXP protease specificity-enhancing factor [Zoogloeaceae bacterium]